MGIKYSAGIMAFHPNRPRDDLTGFGHTGLLAGLAKAMRLLRVDETLTVPFNKHAERHFAHRPSPFHEFARRVRKQALINSYSIGIAITTRTLYRAPNKTPYAIEIRRMA